MTGNLVSQQNTTPRNFALSRNGWSLSLPVFGMTLLLVMSNVVDAIFLSKISADAVGAVGALFSVIAVIVFILRQLSQASGSLIGQLLGCDREKDVIPVFVTSLIINVCFSIMAIGFLVVIKDHIGLWLGLSTPMAMMSSQYLGIIAPGLLIQALTVSFIALSSAYGKTLWNLWVILATNLLNILLNTLLMFGAFSTVEFGIESVAVSTVVSQVIGLLMIGLIVFNKLNIDLNRNDFFSVHWQLLKKILAIGLPASLIPISMQLNLLMITWMAIKFGPSVLLTQIYTINILIVVVAWSSAMAVSTQIVISRYVGERGFDKANEALYTGIRRGMLGAVLGVGLLSIFSDTLYGIFTTDLVIAKNGAMVLFVCLLMEPFRAVNLVTLASLSASGDAKFPALMSVVIMWFFGVPLAWFLGVQCELGLIGMYIGRMSDEILRSVIVLKRWNTERWKKGHL